MNWQRRAIFIGITLAIIFTIITFFQVIYPNLFRDSDHDRLPDSDPLHLCDEIRYGTDPHKPDTDGDYLGDGLEVYTTHTNPLKVDTDGGGVDDFNELFTYGMNPNDPNDDMAFIQKIPNVEAKLWTFQTEGEKYNLSYYGNKPLSLFPIEEYVILSMRDPLIRWYAEHTEITWVTTPEGERIGKIYTDEKPIWTDFTPNVTFYESVFQQPSYYFTHGRYAVCYDSTLVDNVILRLMGYKVRYISGERPAYLNASERMDHAWNEALIDGAVYVVEFNNLYPRSNFYEKNNWTVYPTDYDADWYKR